MSAPIPPAATDAIISGPTEDGPIAAGRPMKTKPADAYDGPFFDDLSVGDRFDTAPTIRLSDGMAAAHHAIVGGRLRLAFDTSLAKAVAGAAAPLAAPAFVWDISIGQSTSVTQRAIANLFYRGLVFRRAPVIGDSLKTVTTILGLKPLSPKPDRPPRGLVTMRIATVDQEGRPVLDYCRCAMLPARSQDPRPAAGETDLPGTEFTQAQLLEAVSGWRMEPFRRAVPVSRPDGFDAGSTYELAGGDVVSSAPELARLTMNLATVHHDRTTAGGGRRLVYGGHTIGLAAAQLTRIFPGLVTILAWRDCDHLGPVHEGDTVHSSVTIERCDVLSGGARLAHLRSRVRATDLSDKVSDVLDWRLVGLFA